MNKMNTFNVKQKEEYVDGVRYPSICVYHGSNIIIEKPQILTNSYTKDFGYGFYLTKISKQAESWAKRKGRRLNNSVVSVFGLEVRAFEELNSKYFKEVDDEWLDFIANCRADSKYQHGYDIIEGPMADDTIYNYVNAYLAGEISKNAFLDLCKFRYTTNQIILTSDKALSYLKYRRCYSV